MYKEIFKPIAEKFPELRCACSGLFILNTSYLCTGKNESRFSNKCCIFVENRGRVDKGVNT
jgi:hypothetical protein